jgi:lysophospholipase L1-like esterase
MKKKEYYFLYTTIIGYLMLMSFEIQAWQGFSVSQEYKSRGGLNNFYKKAINGDQDLIIAYLGGSITEAAGGWRDQSFKAIQERFPQTKFSIVNAGIGGTGSDLGVFRVDSQVLKFKPDLLFIEFAVNDQNQDKEKIYKAMEGIVRKVIRHNPRTAICFVYTLTGDMVSGIVKGQMPNSVEAMEEIADYYSLPSIHLGLQVAALYTSGKLELKGRKEDYPDKIVFSPDNVHPYPETGQKLYTEALMRSLKNIFQNDAQAVVRKELGKPFRKDNWEDAKMIAVETLEKIGSWIPVDSKDHDRGRIFKHPFTSFLRSNHPGDFFRFRFKGMLAGLYDVVGPDGGAYDVSIDDKLPVRYQRFDKYATYYRPQYFFIRNTDKKVHQVKFSVAEVVLDKAAILKERGNKIEDPERYRDNACYAGYLLLIGDLKK